MVKIRKSFRNTFEYKNHVIANSHVFHLSSRMKNHLVCFHMDLGVLCIPNMHSLREFLASRSTLNASAQVFPGIPELSLGTKFLFSFRKIANDIKMYTFVFRRTTSLAWALLA